MLVINREQEAAHLTPANGLGNALPIQFQTMSYSTNNTRIQQCHPLVAFHNHHLHAMQLNDTAIITNDSSLNSLDLEFLLCYWLLFIEYYKSSIIIFGVNLHFSYRIKQTIFSKSNQAIEHNDKQNHQGISMQPTFAHHNCQTSGKHYSIVLLLINYLLL